LDYSKYALGTLLNILTKIVFEDTNAELAELGLSSDLVGVLWAVELDPGRSQIEYAQMRFRDPTTLGRHVDQLVEKGYLRREELPDRRAKAVHITPVGSKITKKALAIVRGVEKKVLHPLDAEKRRMLFQILHEILTEQRSSQIAKQN
jgi:DNA-binding MarR family transcriptional regulator